MLVRAIMDSHVPIFSEQTTITDAASRMMTERKRYFAVNDEAGKWKGIVTDYDIKKAFTSQSANVSSIMKSDMATAHPMDNAEELASLFYQDSLEYIPVIEENRIIGIVTEKEMLHTLVRLTGAHQPSSKLEIKVINKAGQLAEVASIIKEHHINIHSVLVYPCQNEAEKVLVFRLATMNPLPVIQHLENEGYPVLGPVR
ncbi:CBS domain-containing protein [Fictibacillus iocasae]|uniref:CBS domain-containing protein n=1 Tax=Fictibacillus iocasae TaxID=2715437 RepID=A0ABW2NVI4_9BACL